ncbi:MAG: bacillithiol biosynthesis deacetylase BshB1 [Ignavibacteriales bacterium CG_4_9_14_3_um_filter_30_11]|nr:MAG: bacillithiol biosynthesis deacetylase BshB1 [Ignavibacteriales bacterium CG_4_9_14_3_um_filter_30_11]
MNLDVLVFAAHPDDAELSMGGTIAKLSSKGKKVGIVDFTEGEMGTRGTTITRQAEAYKAAVALNVTLRENLHIPDGNIQRIKENVDKVICEIRKYKPKIIFAPYFNDRHPDHIDASVIVKKAMFTSGLTKAITKFNERNQNAYRPNKLFYYMQTYTFEPTFIVDITNHFDKKMKSVKAYKSQFHNPKSSEPETFISSTKFLDYISSRARFYGFQIRKEYGEPFYCEEALEVDLNNLI